MIAMTMKNIITKLLFAIGVAVMLMMSSVQGKALDETSNEVTADEQMQTILRYYDVDERIDWTEMKFVGDILYTKGQINDGKKKRRRRRDTSTLVIDTQIWKDGIVNYFFGASMNCTQRETVQRSMKIIERISCVRFVEQPGFDVNHLIITQGPKCASAVGSGNFPQSLNVMFLKFPECFTTGTILHELLHSLGFHHEQQRPDRDEHVKINCENILPGNEINFAKVQTPITLTEKYNRRSIMHYKAFDFSKNGEPTIECLHGDQAWCKLGGIWLRPTDIRQLNSMYDCPARRDC